MYLTEEVIKSQIYYSCTKLSIFFLNTALYNSSIYSKKDLSTVVQICQKYNRERIKYLLVENEYSYTIWLKNIEKKWIPNNEEKKIFHQHKCTVACIDDSKTIQKLVKSSLERFGYKIISITNPSEQLLEVFEQKPSLIFLDVNMPEINGYQVLQILKGSNSTKDIPVVMLTGQTDLQNKLKAKLNGVKGYITKPFNPQHLINSLQILV